MPQKKNSRKGDLSSKGNDSEIKPRLSPPWRNISFKKKKGKHGEIGTVKAEVWLGDRRNCNYAWHPVTFSTDIEGYQKIAALSEDRQAQLLESVATMPVRNKLFTGKKKPRGKNNERVLSAMYTGAWLGLLILQWIEYMGGAKTQAYQDAVDRVKKESNSHPTHKDIATYLVEKNWCNAFKEWPKGLTPPTDDPEQFFKVVKRNKEYSGGWKMSSEPIEKVISDILQGKDPIILSHPSADKSIFMTWF